MVNIAPDRAAKEAAAALNGSQVGGHHIEVRLADPNMSIGIPGDPNAGRENSSPRAAGSGGNGEPAAPDFPGRASAAPSAHRRLLRPLIA